MIRSDWKFVRCRFSEIPREKNKEIYPFYATVCVKCILYLCKIHGGKRKKKFFCGKMSDLIDFSTESKQTLFLQLLE